MRTIENKVSFLKSKIENWFKTVKLEYNVEGSLKYITSDESEDTITVKVIEDKEESELTLSYISDYSKEELYYIWMENF